MSLLWLPWILQKSLINVLFYLTFSITVNIDVISQHISELGLSLRGDKRLKASASEEADFVSLLLWDLNESKSTLRQPTSVVETLWISDYVTPSKPAKRLPPKNCGPLPSPNNMQPGCQKSPWNCVFQISNDHTMLLSGRYEDIVLHCLSKWTPLYITLNYFGCLWQ